MYFPTGQKIFKAKAEMEGMQKRLLLFIQFIVSLIRNWSSILIISYGCFWAMIMEILRIVYILNKPLRIKFINGIISICMYLIVAKQLETLCRMVNKFTSLRSGLNALLCSRICMKWDYPRSSTIWKCKSFYA